MNGNGLSNYTKGFGLSAAVMSVLNGLLVLLKETHEQTVLAWMKAATGHHWITHGVIVIGLFLVIGYGLAKSNGGQGPKVSADALVKILLAGAVVGYLIIAGFNLAGD